MQAADINTIVVAGAGTMGASMAQIFAKHGCNVFLYDIAEAALERGRKLVQMNQLSQIESGDLTPKNPPRSSPACVSRWISPASLPVTWW